MCGETDTFQGLVLKAAPGVSVELFSGYKEGDLVAPAEVVKTEEGSLYFYPGLAGAYRCVTAAEGCYRVTKSIAVAGSKHLDVTPPKMAGNGWEPREVSAYTDEVIAGPFSDDLSQWPAYKEVLTTPHFTDVHGAHQITTQSRMEAFLRELAGDRVYVYSMGTSAIYHHDIPIVLITRADLSGASDLAEAAERMDKDKLTIVIRAQMHGREPSGGEAALAMIQWLAGKLGDELLDKMNVCVIPRQNPDGAQTFERTVGEGIDPNRDNLRLCSPEMTACSRACQLLNPDIIIDAHEYTNKAKETEIPAGDVLVQAGYVVENTETFQDLSLALARAIFDAAEEKGLTYRFYNKCASSVNPGVSGAYSSKQGTVYILLETPGIGAGLTCYARRIMAHISSMEAILRFAAKNPDRIRDTVTAERQLITEKGGKYDPENIVALNVVTEEIPALQHPVWTIDQSTGVATESLLTPIAYTDIVRSRTAPTAYVIPAGEDFTEVVLALMDKHGIAYSFLPEGSTVELQQYGEEEGITLTEERSVTFPKGAYVFCKNQCRGILLSSAMEPDLDLVAKQNGTFVQQGVLRATDGLFPLYRYVRDLNDRGFIDYR